MRAKQRDPHRDVQPHDRVCRAQQRLSPAEVAALGDPGGLGDDPLDLPEALGERARRPALVREGDVIEVVDRPARALAQRDRQRALASAGSAHQQDSHQA
jgi:hypothetical protein